ncbi:hypothetical protein SAMN04487820_11472 [Actinopolyspora mzabensis]|uniref:Uncharacterized protein n=1 Tax=Actinopolyspora mzabensis TaxID=995066 RepID=A0A1G9FAC3_ACTMZ|nr:hypothetical protein SAMN04487820_11472 [Actinopolyspora mzabensis]
MGRPLPHVGPRSRREVPPSEQPCQPGRKTSRRRPPEFRRDSAARLRATGGPVRGRVRAVLTHREATRHIRQWCSTCPARLASADPAHPTRPVPGNRLHECVLESHPVDGPWFPGTSALPGSGTTTPACRAPADSPRRVPPPRLPPASCFSQDLPLRGPGARPMSVHRNRERAVGSVARASRKTPGDKAPLGPYRFSRAVNGAPPREKRAWRMASTPAEIYRGS